MKTLDMLEKYVGTLYILVALVPIPFGVTILLLLLSSIGVQVPNEYYYFYLLPLSIIFLVVSFVLTRKFDLGQMKTSRRIRRFCYFALVLIPIIILVAKVFNL